MKKFVIIGLLMVCSAGAFAQSAADTAKFAAGKPRISDFLALVNSSGTNIFNGRPVTVLAIDNKTLLAMPGIDTLINNVSAAPARVNFINDRLIPGKFTSKDLLNLVKQGSGQAAFTALSGKKYTVTINANRNFVLTDEEGTVLIVKSFDIFYKDASVMVVGK